MYFHGSIIQGVRFDGLIEFNLEQLFGSVFETTEDLFHQVRIYWPMPWRAKAFHPHGILLLVLEGYLRAFALQEQIAVELPPRPNHYPNKSDVLFGHFRSTSRHSHIPTQINLMYGVIYSLGTTFNSSIKRAARAIRGVSVADRIKSQPMEAIKTVLGTTATAVGNYRKVELKKSKAANGAARTANGLEWHKL